MSESASPTQFGRVDADGTVYLVTAAGERRVGQIPDVSAEEALAFYVRRYEALEVEAGLLESRIKAHALAPEEARRATAALRASLADANVVGDLDALGARLDALAPAIAEASEARKAERAQAQEISRAAKERMVAEAERLAEGNDWRGGIDRFRVLLDEWKALPRLDRASDDALWHRFSAARTAYTRRRKTQFAEQSAKRDAARVAKQAIIAEARELATSTDWGPTTAAFRDLMTRWKAVGPASRDVDDKLWQEFRGVQDEFFSARQATFDTQDAEYAENLTKKQALLAQAEQTVVPVTDLAASRAAFRSFLEEYNAIGRVPRDQIRALDARVRALETAVRGAEEDEWRRTDPQAKARAEETVAMLAAQIAKLNEQAVKALDRGDAKAAAKANDSIATYQTWLDQARATLADFSR